MSKLSENAIKVLEKRYQYQRMLVREELYIES